MTYDDHLSINIAQIKYIFVNKNKLFSVEHIINIEKNG